MVLEGVYRVFLSVLVHGAENKTVNIMNIYWLRESRHYGNLEGIDVGKTHELKIEEMKFKLSGFSVKKSPQWTDTNRCSTRPIFALSIPFIKKIALLVSHGLLLRIKRQILVVILYKRFTLSFSKIA